MAELSLVPACTFSSNLFDHQEQNIPRASKDFLNCLPSPRTRTDILRSGSASILEDPWKCLGWMMGPGQYVKLDSAIKRPVLIDVKESRSDLMLFNFGDEEQCRKEEHFLRFLMSRSGERGGEGINFSKISNMLRSDAYRNYFHQRRIPLDNKFVLGDGYQQSLVDFIGDSSLKIPAQPDRLLPFSGTKHEMKDLLSIVEEFYLSNDLATLSNRPFLVPQFVRTKTSEVLTDVQTALPKLQTVIVTPLKSPKKTKLKQSQKKRNTKIVGNERDTYKRSNFHACESLLSLVLDKKNGSNTTLLDLKNFDTELPQLLTQFSSGIAGIGLAVVFSVVCKVYGGRAPFCASKMLNTGFGLGLVWLSWAVNKLRDNIICITKNTSKEEVKEKEMIGRFDTSIKEIFFRAAAVMTVAILRFV